jgi:Integrase core domain
VGTSRRSQEGQHPYVESFGGRLRDELLAVEAFSNLLEAQVLVEDWRIEYNTLRLHSALGYLTPTNYAKPGPPLTPHSHNALMWSPLGDLGVCESGDVGCAELLEFNRGAPT